MALTAGNIAFVGFNADGSDNLAFVALVDINPNEVIIFEDNEWNGTTWLDTNENAFSWTATSLVTAGTIVSIENIGAGVIAASTGTAVLPVAGRGSGRGIGNSNEVIYAYQGDPAAPTFITAISNVGFTALSSGLLTNTGLTAGTNAIDLSPKDDGADIAAFDGARNNQASFAAYLPIINNPNNWITQDAGGDQNADGTAPDAPFSSTVFTINAGATPTVTIAAQDANAAEAATDAGTFRISRTGSTTNALTVNYTVATGSGQATSADYTPALTGTATIAAGQSFVDITITPVDDALVEGTETVTLNLTSNANYTLGTATATVAIADNDVSATPTVNLSVSLNAGTETGTTLITVTATASSPVSGSQTVNLGVTGTGITIGDYNLSNSVITIPNGQTTGSVTFTVVDDVAIEDAETAILTIGSPTSGITLGATTSQNIAITDNDVVPTRINAVQGSAATQITVNSRTDGSPLNTQSVTIEGVVVADFQNGTQLSGFFIQEEDSDRDNNAATSEGIFVFTGTTPILDVQEGQVVRVTGNVSEFFGMTQVTATAAGSLQIVNANNNLNLVTPTTIDLPPTGDINAFYEQYEGMRVKFADKLYVAEYFEQARYGQIVLNNDARPFQYSHTDSTPTVAENTAYLDNLNRNRIILDDDNNRQNAPLPSGKFLYPQPDGFGTGTQGTNYFRGGDSISDLTGVLHWSFAGQTGTDAWRIRPTQANPIAFTVENPRPTTAPNVGGNVKVASFNVLNYFNTIDTVGGSGSPRGADSVDEFDRQNAKLVDALTKLNADVFGLIEIENNGDAANPAVKELVTRLNAALGSEVYDYIRTGKVGTDQITNAYIYKKAVLEPRGAAAILTDQQFVNPNNFTQDRNRPAIAQNFRVIDANNPDFGESFNVVVNHFKSKGGGDAVGADIDQADGQGQFNDTRNKAASYLVNTWIPSDPTGQGDADYLIIGDLNAYKGEAPITTIKNAGYTDLVESFGGNNAYGYVFNGQLGYLDHALANNALRPQVTGVSEWHINADEVPVFDYNNSVDDGAGESSFEAEPTGNNLYEPNAFRTSDHDPVLIGLNLNSNQAPTQVALSNTTTTLLENTSTAARIKVADVNVTDDGKGTNLLSVSGSDATFFEVDSTGLYLKSGTTLDFETKASYNVTVNVDDNTVGTTTPDASVNYSLSVGDQVVESVDLSTYVRIGRYNLPEPTRTTAPANNLLAQEVSAVTYNWDTNTLFMVGDGGKAIVQVSKTGQLINSMTMALGSSPQGTEFYDTEGLTYVGNGQFVLVEERGRQVSLFTYNPAITLIRADVKTVDLGTDIGNIGLEGISYDPQTNGFIVVKENTPQGIFQTGINFVAGSATNGSASTVNSTNLFDPALAGLIDFADIFALSNLPSLAGAADSDNLLLLSQESAKVVNIDRTGAISSSLTLVSDAGNPVSIADQGFEGVTMDRNGFLYLTSEEGGGDIDHPQLWVYAPSTFTYTNQAPLAVSLANKTASLSENTSIATSLKVANIIVSDDALGTNSFSLTGADASAFEITGNGLFIKAGTALDFETKTSYNVTVNVNDATVGNTPDASTNFTFAVTDISEDPTTLFITEVAPWSSGNSPVGADWFELTNTGTSAVDITGWKFDDNSNSFANSVALTGITSIGASESVIFVENAADTIYNSFKSNWFGANTPTGFQIGRYTGSGVGLSTSGDAVNIFDASGALKANVSFGTSPTVLFKTFDNAALANNAAIATLSNVGTNGAFTAVNSSTEIGSPGRIANANSAPTAVVLSSQVNAIAENTSTATRIKVADIAITDDALGTNSLSVSGTDASFFEVDATGLYLKANTALNFEAKTSYTINVNVDDTTVGNTPDATTIFSLSVTNVNEAPVVSTAIADQNSRQGNAFNFQIPINTFSDIDAGDVLIYSATLENGNTLPNWLAFNSTTRTFSGVPASTDIGTQNVKVTASDLANATVSDIFALFIANAVTGNNGLISGATPGDDVLIASTNSAFNGESNTLFTGAGSDRIDLRPVSANPNSGNNRIDTGSGDDTIFVSQGDRVFGGDGNDTIDARDGKGGNRMTGGAGDDRFFLGSGDRALGGDGNDQFFVSSGGNNLLSGGAGADIFNIFTAGKTLSAANTILDFQVGTDLIGIGGATFNDLDRQGNSITIANNLIATLTGVNTSTLTAANFTFV
jgi:predicted extracellular nuclease/uncharacterized protein YjiK